MANSSTVQTGITTLVQDNIGHEVVSVLFPRFVLLYLLLRKNGDKQGPYGLGRPMVDGRPNTGIFVAGKRVSAPRKEQIMGALEFKPLIQFQELQDYTSNITALHDSDTSVENWEDNQIESTTIRPSFRWSVKQTPIEVSKMNLRMMKAAAEGVERRASQAIGDVWLAHTNHALAQHCRGINNELNGGSTPSTSTDAPSSVTSDLWSKQYSIPSILHTTNNYAGIDRSLAANTWWHAKRNTTSQSLNIREMLTYARYTAGLSDYGLFVDCLIMGNDLYPSALAQMDALKGQVFHSGGFPDFPEVGYNRQVAVVDGSVAIINEPGWPAGYVAGLSLDTWFVAIHPDANFTASEPERQDQIAGGHRSVAANIETQWMYGCVHPAGNVIWTTVTA
jgi:hypothetical protein